MDLQYKQFKNVNINDPFFDSLKQDYEGFETWFEKNRMNLLTFSRMKWARSTVFCISKLRRG